MRCGALFREPQRAVRPGRDVIDAAIAVGQRKFGDGAGFVIRPILFPPVTVYHKAPSGPAVMPNGRFVPKLAGQCEFGDRAAGRDAADLVAVRLGEPQRAVGAGAYSSGLAVGSRH